MEIKAPTFPESIADGSVAEWHHQVGDFVAKDDLLVDIETDKVVIEVYAPADGVLSAILKGEGETVLSEEVVAQFTEGAGAADSAATASPETTSSDGSDVDRFASPAAKKLAAEKNLNWATIAGTGKDGRITKEDVVAAVAAVAQPSAATTAAVVASAAVSETTSEPATVDAQISDEGRVERRVPMTRLRASVAKRLVAAQQNAAMLTTFNEVDMQPIMTLRKRYQAEFQRAHNDTRLGFMSFFVRAATEALKRFPAVNASIDGEYLLLEAHPPKVTPYTPSDAEASKNTIPKLKSAPWRRTTPSRPNAERSKPPAQGMAAMPTMAGITDKNGAMENKATSTP